MTDSIENGKSLLKTPGTGDHPITPELKRKVTSSTGSRMADMARETSRRVCSMSFLKDRLPILNWAGTYNLDMLTGDFIAGLTTALTVIPQGIGYAPLAGLPLQYGLYASIVPGFLYCLLGTTRQTTVGPTAVNSLMSFNYAGGVPYKAVTLAFFTGLIEIMAGVLNLGFLIQYISIPVIKAFSTAVSLQVITSQVKGFLGISFPGRGFIQVWRGVFENITSTRPYDTLVGVVCMVILYILRKLKEVDWCEGNKDDPTSSRVRVVKKVKWLFSISANCLVVVITSVLAWLLVLHGIEVLKLTGEVDSGLPAWQLPWNFNRNFSSETTVANNTKTVDGPLELATEFGIGILMLPLVSILQHLAIAKHYAGNKAMAASQEIIALGICQFVGSFTGSMAVTASFGRSAVNSTSGVRSPFGGVFTGIIIILACVILSPYLAFIPTSALAAVIISSMFSTIDTSIPPSLWRSKRVDLIPYTLTLLLGLFVSVESGLIVGTLIHLGLLIHSSTSSPRLQLDQSDTHVIIRPHNSLFYPLVDHLRSGMVGLLEDEDKPVIVDLSLVHDIDYSAAKSLSSLLTEQSKKGVDIEIYGANSRVTKVINAVHGEGLIFRDSMVEVVTHSNC